MATEGGDGVEFDGAFAVYNDYFRECLEDAGLLAEEVAAIFSDNSRLVADIQNVKSEQKRGTEQWIKKNREQSRERMRRMRAKHTLSPT